MNIQEFSVRRGLVLGFTAAEIVVLLLFLLLLIMGILYHTSGESEDEAITESTLGDDEQYLDEIPPYEVLITQYSKIVRELEVERAQKAEIDSDIELKQERIDILATNLEEAVARNERYQALIKDQQNETHALRSQVEELNQEIDDTN